MIQHRTPRIAVGTLPLLVAGLVLPGALVATLGPAAPADAACAPSTVVAAKHAHAAAKVKVHRGAAAVTKRSKRGHQHRRAYVARVAITAKQGTATVAVTQSVCPDGAAGAAASATQSATGNGILTKSVSARGHSKRVAKKLAKAKAKKAVAKLKKKGATKKGRRKAKRRAVAAARPLAVSKARDALYLSDVVYAAVGADGVYHLTAAPAAGQVTLARTAGGDLALTVPARFQPRSATSRPCIRRAPAWPTRFVFDGGDVVAPVLEAAATAASDAGLGTAVYSVNAAPWQDPTGAAAGQESRAEQRWFGGWQSGSGGAATYHATLSPGTPAAAPLVCLELNRQVAAGYVAVLHGAHVGAAAVSVGGEMRVPGGLAVTLR